LETLAWYPDFFPRVALILAKLARLAPKVKIANTPWNSLAEIFCTWHRNSAASLDDRLQILDRLVKREPEVGWKLLLNLLPKSHDVSGNTATPRWRARPEVTAVTYGELWRAHEGLVKRALALSDLDGRHLAELCPKTASWSPVHRRCFLESVRKYSETSGDDEARTQLWKSVREFVSRHRTFKDAEWALPEAEVAPFGEVLNLLKPNDLGEGKLWLFDEHLPFLPDSPGGSVEERKKQVAEARRNAVTELMKAGGLDAILAAGRRVKLPWQIGISLAEIVTNTQTEHQLLERTLAAPDANERKLGRAYVVRSYSIKGPAWAEQFLGSDVFKSWPPTKRADFCLGLPEEPSTWRLASTLGVEVEAQYWAEAFVSLSRLERGEDAEFAIAKLSGSGRDLYALDQAALDPEKLSSGTLTRILENALVELAKAGDKLPVDGDFAWSLGRILEKLRASDEVPVEVLGRLEWQCLPLLQFQERPVTLHRFLQSDPRFFADLVAYAFRSELEEGDASTPSDVSEEEKRNRARHAWEVLRSWDKPPGSRPDGTVDLAELNSWVREARSLCSARHRGAVGDGRIGSVLAHAPKDDDGIWPHRSIRELLEDVDSRNLESGMRSGKLNQQGVTTRDPLEGGRREREIAKTYRNWAKTVAVKWRNTARLLKSLAQTYEGFAGMHDVSAEKLDLEY
jgi:hypothetical protein